MGLALDNVGWEVASNNFPWDLDGLATFDPSGESCSLYQHPIGGPARPGVWLACAMVLLRHKMTLTLRRQPGHRGRLLSQAAATRGRRAVTAGRVARGQSSLLTMSGALLPAPR